MKKLLNLFPRYAYIPSLLLIIIQISAFYLTRLINSDLPHYCMETPVDGKIPFLPIFGVFYVLAFLQWAVSYYIVIKDSTDCCYRFFSADIVCKAISLLIFLIMPTVMDRPHIEGNGLGGFIMSIIFFLDSPDNLFPSLHCVTSWLCVRQSFAIKRFKRWYAILQIVVTALVFASVVLVKQHLFIDIIGGVAVAEIGILISDKLKLSRFLDKLNRFIWKKRYDSIMADNLDSVEISPINKSEEE